MARVRTIDPERLAEPLCAAEAEGRMHAQSERLGLYGYDPDRGREETFVVDTPPPTVSGSLHVGHIFSFTHADVIARQQRMLGKNIFYTMGWDDMALPPGRGVQNYFTVGVDARPRYEPALRLEQPTAESSKQPPRM